MEVRRYARALRRGWVLVVLCPLLAALVAGAVSWRMHPVYEANGSLLVRPAQPLAVETGTVAETADEITQTYGALMTEGPILQKVIDDLQLRSSPSALSKDITVTPRTNTTILDITVSNTNPVLAAEVANQLMGDFITTMKQVQTQENTPGTDQDNFVIIQPASVPTSPSSPNIPRNVLLAAVAGLLLAVGAILLRDYLDQSVKSDEELIERTGLVPIAHVAFTAPRHERRGELTVMQDSSPASEAYRSLRTNLLFSNVDRPLRTILITSSAPGEGKSRTAANLAIVLAQSGHRTALVDADFRRPSQHRNFGFVRNVGFSNLVIQEVQEDQALHAIDGVTDLMVLPSGPPPPNPSELLGSARARAVVDRLRDAFEFVVIDSPPINAVTDAAVLATFTDGVIMVVESGRTSYGAVTHAKQTLERVGAHVVGAVLNKMRAGRAGQAYGYEYYYGYTYVTQNDGNGYGTGGAPPAAERTASAIVKRLTSRD
jgi:polysaccharide biosynthesis transport protein